MCFGFSGRFGGNVSWRRRAGGRANVWDFGTLRWEVLLELEWTRTAWFGLLCRGSGLAAFCGRCAGGGGLLFGSLLGRWWWSRQLRWRWWSLRLRATLGPDRIDAGDEIDEGKVQIVSDLGEANLFDDKFVCVRKPQGVAGVAGDVIWCAFWWFRFRIGFSTKVTQIKRREKHNRSDKYKR